MKKLRFLLPLLLLPLLASSQLIINSYRYESVVDTDAQAFIDAVSTLTTAEEEAIDDLVVGLKAGGLWTKLDVIYPMIGGTAAEHKWNLKDPRDLDAAHRAEFFEDAASSWTHDANGAYHASSTATNAQSWLNTNYQTSDFSTNGVEYEISVSIYNNIDISSLARPQLIASYWTGTDSESCDMVFYHKDTTVGEMDVRIGSGAGETNAETSTTGKHFYTGTTDGADAVAYMDGVEQASAATGTRDGGTTVKVLGIGTSANGSSPYTMSDGFNGENSSGRYAFISIGQVDLTATNVSDLYDIVVAYQTALNREN